MIAEALLVAWLIACIFVPLVYAVTSSPPAEVRTVTNALVRQRAEVLARELEPHDRAIAREPRATHAVEHDEPNRALDGTRFFLPALRV